MCGTFVLLLVLVLGFSLSGSVTCGVVWVIFCLVFVLYVGMNGPELTMTRAGEQS